MRIMLKFGFACIPNSLPLGARRSTCLKRSSPRDLGERGRILPFHVLDILNPSRLAVAERRAPYGISWALLGYAPVQLQLPLKVHALSLVALFLSFAFAPLFD